MTSRFEKFSERARRVLSLAQEEAQRFNHSYISTEHILLGLVRETDGVAAKVLSAMGVEVNKVRSAVEFIIGRGERTASGEIGLTPRAKKVIELAVDEARRLNHHYIGTEHLLIGLMRYVFLAAGWIWPQLRADLPESYRRKLVCVVQGVVLLIALGPIIPDLMALVVVATGLALLIYSFGIDVFWAFRNSDG